MTDPLYFSSPLRLAGQGIRDTTCISAHQMKSDEPSALSNRNKPFEKPKHPTRLFPFVYLWPANQRRTDTLTRAHVEKVVGYCTGKADMEAFRSYTAPGFVFEIMGTQPAAGEWQGVDAMQRQFAAFKENFTSEFQFNSSGIYVDVEKKTAAVLLHSLPLTDKGGGEYQQHCGWFMYFDDHDKITRIVQYDDTKLVDDMTLRVATAKMRALQKQDSTRSTANEIQRDRAA